MDKPNEEIIPARAKGGGGSDKRSWKLPLLGAASLRVANLSPSPSLSVSLSLHREKQPSRQEQGGGTGIGKRKGKEGSCFSKSLVKF